MEKHKPMLQNLEMPNVVMSNLFGYLQIEDLVNFGNMLLGLDSHES